MLLGFEIKSELPGKIFSSAIELALENEAPEFNSERRKFL